MGLAVGLGVGLGVAVWELPLFPPLGLLAELLLPLLPELPGLLEELLLPLLPELPGLLEELLLPLLLELSGLLEEPLCALLPVLSFSEETLEFCSPVLSAPLSVLLSFIPVETDEPAFGLLPRHSRQKIL